MFQYKSLYGIRPMVLRLSNPYGKYHTFKRQGVINVAMNDAKEGLEFEVWGDGNTVKDYIYVNDVCKIIYELYEKEAFGEVINVASGELMSVNEILDEIKKIYADLKWKYKEAILYDVNRVELDTSKLDKLVKIEFSKFKDVIGEL